MRDTPGLSPSSDLISLEEGPMQASDLPAYRDFSKALF